jgi:hypothetical protein
MLGNIINTAKANPTERTDSAHHVQERRAMGRTTTVARTTPPRRVLANGRGFNFNRTDIQAVVSIH